MTRGQAAWAILHRLGLELVQLRSPSLAEAMMLVNISVIAVNESPSKLESSMSSWLEFRALFPDLDGRSSLLQFIAT